MPGILDGVRVIDLTSVVMGPLATKLLGDLGADVIKVERPGGDSTRQSTPARSKLMGQGFLAINHNKRSISVDLKNDEGRKILFDLMRTADVIVYNIRPSAMARLGLDFEEVQKFNPRIIYVGAFGFSEKGPYAGRAGMDDMLQGMLGVPSLYARSTGQEPRYTPLTFVDRTMSLHVVIAVVGALLHREKTGRGQRVDVPMYENMALSVMAEHLEGAVFVPPAGHMGHARSLSIPRRPYPTSDGHICVLLYTDEHWKRFFKMIGQPEKFQNDARFSTNAGRVANVDYVHDYLAKVLESKTSSEWLLDFEAADLPAGPMYTLQDVVDDDHLREMNFFKKVEHPTEGALIAMTYPTEWSDAVSEYRLPAPRLGEHTLDVLKELGRSSEEIDGLVEKKIVVVAE
jgi:crotonobetainyl-CoA:carnitine CoA-transferase CaiB-like acyl-CoA transferase